MIELNNDGLCFSFPDVHPEARLRVGFQRTLRIPDDETTHPLPPGLGEFPLRHVDDFGARVPARWRERGGVMLPMYQSEALWIALGYSGYPVAVKIAAGKINAVSGEAWATGLNRDPQDYLVTPGQPWLDGFNVDKGIIRQFVAMPLGEGYTAEEQLTGEAEHGGIQIVAYPMKAEVFNRRRESLQSPILYSEGIIGAVCCRSDGMGLAPGGRMRQEIYADKFDLSDWDLRHSSRVFTHLANSLAWQTITGEAPPTTPPSVRDYERAGLPWFEYYGGDLKALEGASRLKKLKGVAGIAAEHGKALPDNDPLAAGNVIRVGPGAQRSATVREADL